MLGAHDVTLSMMLKQMGIVPDESPPFAAFMLYELWNIDGNYWVKLQYNDKIIDLTAYCYENLEKTIE